MMQKARYGFPLAGALLALGACSTVTPQAGSDTLKDEFTTTDIYSYSFAGPPQAACEAARRALLSQGYLINEARPDSVRGNKNFQQGSDEHIKIEFNVVCAPNSKGSNATTAFANAVKDRYSLKKSIQSANLGVSVLGSLSLPLGTSNEMMVKIASETIASRKFYHDFFSLVDRYLDFDPAAPEASPEPADTGKAADFR
ncbi:hypothetical protein SAMN06265795_11968 [Noviherbaspirillum humi]|uniref:DUF2242 domain-containing protein n=1 Tax=Noviherbaspirillum humi TaxID=1688639 RepID=A0A239L4U9_9BURK|nr:DUF2242 domain-containing protein [Noviherbaspirillum humi]SNT25637.1 hypothetical protein SAMN06265795_11968 [Noviherbaspirillum humi]